MRFLIIVVCLLKTPGLAQEPCSYPESSQFDFWIGDWQLEWQDSAGHIQSGRNSIRKVYDDCVIHETFTDSVRSYHGMSVSVYNPTTKQWQQTWVDNAGSYLDFVGEFVDGRMILSRHFKTKKALMWYQRMVWYDISDDAFTWNWERSEDQGMTWRVLWKIRYTRRE